MTACDLTPGWTSGSSLATPCVCAEGFYGTPVLGGDAGCTGAASSRTHAHGSPSLAECGDNQQSTGVSGQQEQRDACQCADGFYDQNTLGAVDCAVCPTVQNCDPDATITCTNPVSSQCPQCRDGFYLDEQQTFDQCKGNSEYAKGDQCAHVSGQSAPSPPVAQQLHATGLT